MTKEECPSVQFMKRRNACGKEKMDMPSQRIKRLPFGKQGQFATSLTKIRPPAEKREAYAGRKVTLISTKNFKRMNFSPEQMVFGTLRLHDRM